jgi:hypothetical protein
LGTAKENNRDTRDRGRWITPFKIKKKCKRGHAYTTITKRSDGRTYNTCLKCKNITRDEKRRKAGKVERKKRNQW